MCPNALAPKPSQVETLEAEGSGDLEQGKWNRILTSEVLPHLWITALAEVIPQLPASTWEAIGCSAEEAMYASLPVDVSSLEQQWRTCCKRTYQLLSCKLIIRHRDADQTKPKWVSPSASLAFTCPTDELAETKDLVMDLYANTKRQRAVVGEVSNLVFGVKPNAPDIYIVSLPPAVQRACVELGGMHQSSIDQVLFCVLTAAKRTTSWPDAPDLYKVLFPLLMYAGRHFTDAQHGKVRKCRVHSVHVK
jgi:hypothetical protein